MLKGQGKISRREALIFFPTRLQREKAMIIINVTIRRLSLIVRVNVVRNRTVVVDSDWRFDTRCRQAVCVTTHRGSWVKLLLCLISIVTRSSSREKWIRHRDQNTAAFSEKHYWRERFREFSRSHSGFRCLLLASQDNFKKFIAIRRRSCDLADFERRLISCFS